MFDLQRILKSGLVRHVEHHESLGSTSDRALELAAGGDAPLPLLILAERQTAGRGRGTNRWWSVEGALMFSLVVDAAGALPPAARPRVALAAGLAICEALAELAPSASWQVKWPNDVLAGGRKACGILCESVPGWPERLVIGVGINVNNACDPARGRREPGAEETAKMPPSATALVDLDGVVRDLTAVLLAVLDGMDWRWQMLASEGFGQIAAQYRRHCFLSGKMLTIASGNQRRVGRCRGIDDQGALLLATETGLCTIIAGSVEAWE
jgi:BirA family transcriptional regulator, biotin operon repressor / biotin---[acetyl-CoA-carboxylase] ligase